VVVPNSDRDPTTPVLRRWGVRFRCRQAAPATRPLGAKRRGRSVLRGVVPTPPPTYFGRGGRDYPPQGGRRGCRGFPLTRAAGTRGGSRAAALASRSGGALDCGRLRSRREGHELRRLFRRSCMRSSTSRSGVLGRRSRCFGSTWSRLRRGRSCLRGGSRPLGLPWLPPPPRRSAPSGGVALDPPRCCRCAHPTAPESRDAPDPVPVRC
jgi:hypothetical protein